MNPSDIHHYPVLYAEVLKELNPKPGDIVLDGTLGRGGHASLIIPKLGTTGRYIGLDCDNEAISYCTKKFGLDSPPQDKEPTTCKIDIIKSNFSKARHVLKKLGLRERGVDIVLADLGFFCLLFTPHFDTLIV